MLPFMCLYLTVNYLYFITYICPSQPTVPISFHLFIQESIWSSILSIWRRTMTICPSLKTATFRFQSLGWRVQCCPLLLKLDSMGTSALSFDLYQIFPWATKDSTSLSQVWKQKWKLDVHVSMQSDMDALQSFLLSAFMQIHTHRINRDINFTVTDLKCKKQTIYSIQCYAIHHPPNRWLIFLILFPWMCRVWLGAMRGSWCTSVQQEDGI